MSRRAARIALLAVLAGCRSADAKPPGVGDLARGTFMDDGSGRPVVAWIVRGEDYLGCQTSAGDLRGLQRRHGNAIRLSVLYVGESPEWVRAFVRRERIAAEIHALRRSEFRARFGRLRLPAFYVTDGARVVARVESPDGLGPAGDARARLEAAITRVLDVRPDSVERREPHD